MRKLLLLAVGWLLAAVPLSAAERDGVVIVVDGAGDYRGMSTAMTQAVMENNSPLVVEPACWSHGYGRSIADQMDRAHARAQGERLAARVLAYRETCPGRPIFLMAHSAGGTVVLEAAQCLPPDSVERIILLEVTMSAYVDVRPMLCCSRQGVDVFCSCRDRCAWFVSFTLIGAEGHLCPLIAARRGFVKQKPVTLEDHLLYRKLRQYHWDPSWSWTGHEGGHYGIYMPGFLRHVVLPMLQNSD